MAPRPAAARAAEAAWDRARRLGPGVNLSLWRPGETNPPGAEGRATLAEVAGYGFRHVRLPVDVSGAIVSPGGLADRLAGDVAAAHAAGLSVILDMHPPDSFRSWLGAAPDAWQRFAGAWTTIARRLRRADPQRLLLELLNEPGDALGQRWHVLQAQLIRVVQAAAPDHTILATGALWSTIGDLGWIDALPDPNLVFGFHFYSPMMFTHQGADWSPPFDKVRGVPYPLSPADAAAIAARGPREQRARILDGAASDRTWDAAAIEAEIAQAGAWSQRIGAPIVCTEFGAYKGGGAPPRDRLRYLADVRASLDRHAQAWTLWDYGGGFGLMRRQGGRMAVDQEMLRALGLA